MNVGRVRRSGRAPVGAALFILCAATGGVWLLSRRGSAPAGPPRESALSTRAAIPIETGPDGEIRMPRLDPVDPRYVTIPSPTLPFVQAFLYGEGKNRLVVIPYPEYVSLWRGRMRFVKVEYVGTAIEVRMDLQQRAVHAYADLPRETLDRLRDAPVRVLGYELGEPRMVLYDDARRTR